MWFIANLAENVLDQDYEKYINQCVDYNHLFIAIRANNKWVPIKAPLTKLYLVKRKRERRQLNKLKNIYILGKQSRFGLIETDSKYIYDRDIAMYLMDLNSYYGEDDCMSIMQSHLEAAKLIHFIVSGEYMDNYNEQDLILTLSELIKTINDTGKLRIIISLTHIVESSIDVMKKSMKRNMIEDKRKPLKELYLESIKQMHHSKIFSVYNSFSTGNIKYEIKICLEYLKILKIILERNIEKRINQTIITMDLGRNDINKTCDNIIKDYKKTSFVKDVITDCWDEVKKSDYISLWKSEETTEYEYSMAKEEQVEAFHKLIIELFVVTQKFDNQNALKVLKFLKKYEKGADFFFSKLDYAVLLEKQDDEKIADEIIDKYKCLDCLDYYSVSVRRGDKTNELMDEYIKKLAACCEILEAEKDSETLKLKQNICRNLKYHTKIISFISKNKPLLFDAAEYSEKIAEFAENYCCFFEMLYKILIQLCKNNLDNKK